VSPRLLLSILLAGLALAAGPAAAQIGLHGGLSGGPPQTLGLPGNLPSRLPVSTDDLRALAEPLPDRLRGRAPAAPRQTSVRIGLIDTGIDGRHPAFAGARITQRGFAGPARPGAHGAAVASLMIGRSGGFSGTAPGAELHAADIYGGSAAGGSSTALVEALAWMAENAVPVVNVSLVGPRNALVEAAVRRAVARGMLLARQVGGAGRGRGGRGADRGRCRRARSRSGLRARLGRR